MDPGFAQRWATYRRAREYGLTMPEYYALAGRVKEKCRGTGDGDYHYCSEAWMYGTSVAEFRRRENSTAQICWTQQPTCTAPIFAIAQCVRRLMQGARYKPLPPAVQVTAERTVEEKQHRQVDPADVKLILYAVTPDGRK